MYVNGNTGQKFDNAYDYTLSFVLWAANGDLRIGSLRKLACFRQFRMEWFKTDKEVQKDLKQLAASGV